MVITDYIGSRLLTTYRELNNKPRTNMEFNIFKKKKSNPGVPPPQVLIESKATKSQSDLPEKPPELPTNNNKLSKPLKVRFALTVLILGIGVLCICRESTEAGVALCSATAGYWLK